MGGFGSGRSGWRPTEDQFLRLDVRMLNRKGMLRPGVTGTMHWSREGEAVGSIQIHATAAEVRLIYTSAGLALDYPVHLDRTTCNLGGSRPWFLCPSCCRRVAVLFGGGRFLCRYCRNLAYSVENEDRLTRMFRRSGKIQAKLASRIWWSTRDRLQEQLLEVESRLLQTAGF